MSAEDDKILYGGGETAHLLGPDGVETQYIAADVLLADEFEIVVIAPGDLAENQEVPAFLLTMKGRKNGEKHGHAATIVFDPRMAHALTRAINAKWRELPIWFR